MRMLFILLFLSLFANAESANCQCEYDNEQTDLPFPMRISFLIETENGNETAVSIWIHNMDSHHYFYGSKSYLTVSAAGKTKCARIHGLILKGQTIGPINLTLPVKPTECDYFRLYLTARQIDLPVGVNLSNEFGICPEARTLWYDAIKDCVTLN